jgi:hypothetical protein
MASELRKKLDNAVGTSDNIIALILDIRSFTPFCKEQESVNVANFIKRVYIRIIDDYFPEASFYKPTGDGLLIVMSYTPKTLKELLVKTVQKSLSLIQDFGKLCKEDDMVYFDTPDKIGIGISRGPACCISSDGTVIDYSGRVINLASRLNDIARPCGVVFDSGLGMPLLPKEIQELFLSDNVYIRGIAEAKPITVYFTKQYTIIPPSRKEPFREPRWIESITSNTYDEIKSSVLSGIEYYGIVIKDKPLDEKQIYVEMGFVISGFRRFIDFSLETRGTKYFERGAKRYFEIKYNYLLKQLEELGAKEGTQLDIYIAYPSTGKSA